MSETKRIGVQIDEDDSSDEENLFPSTSASLPGRQNIRLQFSLTNTVEENHQPLVLSYCDGQQYGSSGFEVRGSHLQQDLYNHDPSTSPVLPRITHVHTGTGNVTRTLLDVVDDALVNTASENIGLDPPENTDSSSNATAETHSHLNSNTNTVYCEHTGEITGGGSSMSTVVDGTTSAINRNDIFLTEQSQSVPRAISTATAHADEITGRLETFQVVSDTSALNVVRNLVQHSQTYTAGQTSENQFESNIAEDSTVFMNIERSRLETVQPGLTVSVTSHITETQADFKNDHDHGQHLTKRKRKLTSPSPKNCRKCTKDVGSDRDDDTDDGLSCPICFESWTNSGKHRLVSLKCGHLFGQKCVERWLKDGHQKCPQCNAKAKRADIRVIYAKKLQAIDTVDLEQALKMADEAKHERREQEMELAKMRMQYEMALDECNRLKMKMSKMTEVKECSIGDPLHPATTASNDSNHRLYQFLKSVVIHASGECRIMDFDVMAGNFVVSQPSPHANFISGYGVKKLSALDLKSGYFTKLHNKVIKDLKFNPLTQNQLLSVSMDGCVRITDLSSNTKIHEYQVGKPAWSCCWDTTDKNFLYVGVSNGSYVQFDLRNTSTPVSTLENPSSKCPVVSLYHVPPTTKTTFHGRGGLLSATLQEAMFWQDTDGSAQISNFKPTLFPLDPGSCTGLKYCHKTQHCLVTFRPGRSYATTTHLFCELQCAGSNEDDPRVKCHVLDTYRGGRTHKMITRNALFSVPSADASADNKLTIAVGDEANRRVQIYDASRSALAQTLSCEGGPPLDITPVFHDVQRPMFATLSQSTLNVYTIS